MKDDEVIYAHRIIKVPLQKSNGMTERLIPRSLEFAIVDGELVEFPYLCVSMLDFGYFDVTHVPTGCRLMGGFERAVNALIAMAKFQLACNELDIDLSCSANEFSAAMKANSSDCEALGMPIRQWLLSMQKAESTSDGESSWEPEGGDPHAEYEGLLKKLPKRTWVS